MENNIIYRVPGKDCFLARAEDVIVATNLARYVYEKAGDWEEQKRFYALGNCHQRKTRQLEKQLLAAHKRLHENVKQSQWGKAAVRALRQGPSLRFGNKIVAYYSRLKRILGG